LPQDKTIVFLSRATAACGRWAITITASWATALTVLRFFFATNQPEQVVSSNVTAITGRNHTLFLKKDGSLWGMGRNDTGQLGDGNYNDAGPHFGTNQPVLIVASNVTAIAAGGGDSLSSRQFGNSFLVIPYGHSLFLKNDGSLWAMGYNLFGQLGDGTGNDTNRPEQIVSSNVTAIAAGDFHSLFLKNDGSLWAMGNNQFGQLGDGTTNTYSALPEQIMASNVTVISAALGFSLFLKSDGSLWGMGFNTSGQLGIGTYNQTNNQPVQIVASNVTAVAAGYSHTLFLKSDGSLWAMGLNSKGQLGDGTINNTNRPEMIVPSNVAAIAAGGNHSLFLKSDGTLWAMGSDQYGQLGDGTYTPVNPNPNPKQILGAYNKISGHLLSGDNMQLSFVGIAGANYALDRSANLSVPNWIPQVTNPANSFGAMVFTNTPDPATNNFWRVRSTP
jgi:alpha-tubulin suppressor-like RCC1 family protein